MRYLRGIFLWAVMLGCCGIVAEAGNKVRTAVPVDSQRAVIAAGLMVAIGIMIFLIRNRRMFGNRGNKKYE